MKIVFLHYHLKTGGVTTVIHRQIQALGERHELLVLSGEPSPRPLPVPVVHVPGLAYDSVMREAFPPPETARMIEDAIHDRWPEGCDLLHVHNPTLAKNAGLMKVLPILLQRGFRLLLQIHDFAEDGRPTLFNTDPYPANCHYCVINARDFAILKHSGLKPGGLHLLPNMVGPPTSPDSSKAAPSYILYPVRGLRRKNIGEAVLLSLFTDPQFPIGITQPPSSRVDLQAYEDWADFVRHHHLNVHFNVGSANSFPGLVNAATHMVTTSITEGFGFSFLEPWIADKMLYGRILPDICRDFQDKGLDLDHLYAKIRVPVEWIGEERFLGKWTAAVTRAATAFQVTISAADIDHGYERVKSGGFFDFGMLDETLQRRVILKVLTEPGVKDELASRNPFLIGMKNVSPDDDIIALNKRVIQQSFNRTAYAQTLIGIYENVMETTVDHRIDKTELIKRFLTPDNFSLLKWGRYGE
ncbi:MAG: hypothetical protein HKM93_07765 [Desulfobacteraceae bacterium]|nr:hypothetical protein [Desulfobacteraceae bacterium]